MQFTDEARDRALGNKAKSDSLAISEALSAFREIKVNLLDDPILLNSNKPFRPDLDDLYAGRKHNTGRKHR